jgi:hypothetical protein
MPGDGAVVAATGSVAESRQRLLKKIVILNLSKDQFRLGKRNVSYHSTGNFKSASEADPSTSSG